MKHQNKDLLPWVNHAPWYGPGPCVLPLNGHKLQHLNIEVSVFPGEHHPRSESIHLLSSLSISDNLSIFPSLPPGHNRVCSMVGTPPGREEIIFGKKSNALQERSARTCLGAYFPNTPLPASPVLPLMFSGLFPSTWYGP